jgi:dienelactone hydrolase
MLQNTDGAGLRSAERDRRVASAVAAAARIEVERDDALLDAKTRIRLTGLPPQARVRLAAESTDCIGRRWQSQVDLRADLAGDVDLARSVPLRGSYALADSDGLFWSMQLASGEPERPAVFACDGASTSVVELSASLDGREVAATRFVRHLRAPNVVRKAVDTDGLQGAYFAPEGSETRPGLLLLGGFGGGFKWSETAAALLASRGYAALALAFFGLPGLPKGFRSIPIEYFERATAWLLAQREVDARRTCVIGTSLGGQLALFLAARSPRLRGAVSLQGGGVMFSTPPLFADQSDTYSMCTLRGEPVPCLPLCVSERYRAGVERSRADGSPLRFAQVFNEALADEPAARAAEIPVERIRGPILLASAEDDGMLPSPALAERVVARLRAHGHPHEVVHMVAAGAGHLVEQPNLPAHPITLRSFLGSTLSFGGSLEANARANRATWDELLSFLARSYG